MVKVHDEGAFRVYVYSPPREHEPPHVHVECARGGELLVRLGDCVFRLNLPTCFG